MNIEYALLPIRNAEKMFFHRNLSIWGVLKISQLERLVYFWQKLLKGMIGFALLRLSKKGGGEAVPEKFGSTGETDGIVVLAGKRKMER